jgi:anti-anti-sigma factor
MDHDWRNINACVVCGNAADLESLLWQDGGACAFCEDHPPYLRKVVDGVIVLTFLPELPWKSGARCLEGLAATIQEGVDLVLNLSCVAVPSSLLLGILISARRKVRTAHGTLRLCGLSASAAEVLQTMQLRKLFDIYPDELTAIKAPCPRETQTCIAAASP